eukprot:1143945-Pelagomonas_calceolata.AAC.1
MAARTCCCFSLTDSSPTRETQSPKPSLLLRLLAKAPNRESRKGSRSLTCTGQEDYTGCACVARVLSIGKTGANEDTREQEDVGDCSQWGPRMA